MNTQHLQYLREQIIVATADLSGATKGQLMAWLENAQFDTNTFKRKKLQVPDEVTGKMITLDNLPMPGEQSHAKGSHIPLVQPIEFATASWRRALLSLDEHQKAWLLWSYSGNIRWEHQETITRWAWEQFSAKLAGKRVAKKTMSKLRHLIWLAAQDAKEGLAGRDVYQYTDLAALVGVETKNWSKTFTVHWEGMIKVFSKLDHESLIAASKTRSRQKATNSHQSIAKVD